MTDVATVMPRELRLGSPPTMPQARSYLFRQQSTLSSYSSGSTITINIPRLQRSYLRKDSYLRFSVDGKSDSSTPIALDSSGAFGFFEKIEVFDYLGSTVLESISGVPQLAALLLDLGLEQNCPDSVGSASMGLGEKVAIQPTLPWGVADLNTADTNYNTYRDPGSLAVVFNTELRPSSSGRDLELTELGLDPDTSAWTSEFSIPWLSFLGLLSKKMIPLHNGFTIVLTLASTNTPIYTYTNQVSSLGITTVATTGVQTVGTGTLAKALTTSPVVNWVVRDVFAECQVLELGPEAEAMLLTSTQGQPLVVHTKSFRNYAGFIGGPTWPTPGATINTVTAVNSTGPTEFNLNLNLNVASMTNLLWFMRSKDQLDNITFQSVGCRTRNMLQRWHFQYGSTTLPQSNGIQSMGTNYPLTSVYTPVGKEKQYIVHSTGYTECFQELIKARYYSNSNNRFSDNMYAWDQKFYDALDRRMGVTDQITMLNFTRLYKPSPLSPFGVGKFACGLNLELCNGKEGEIICGLNTNGMNTSIRGFFHPNYTDFMDPSGVRVDAYAEYDAFINISPGIASTVSF